MSFYHLNTVGEICFYVLVSIPIYNFILMTLDFTIRCSIWWRKNLIKIICSDKLPVFCFVMCVCLSVQWLRVTLKRSLRSAQPCMYILGKGFVAFISILVGVHNFNLYFKVVNFFNDRRSSKENSLTTPWSRDLSEKRKFSSNYSTCLTMKLNWCKKNLNWHWKWNAYVISWDW